MPKTPLWLSLLLLIFVLLAAGYAKVSPYRTPGVVLLQGGVAVPDIGAPDERQHVNMVRTIRDTKSLPIFDPKSPTLAEDYEYHQPPLFYILAVPFYGSDGFPIRALNILIGVFTLVGLFWVGKHATGRDEVGLGVASIGLLPMFVALHGAVSNDPLLICLLTWSLVWMFRSDLSATKPLILCGACTGLALLTKSSGLVMLPVLMWFGIQHFRQTPRAWIPFGVACALGSIVWVRNTALYGDPLGQRVFTEAFVGTAQAEMFINELGLSGYLTRFVFDWTSRSFVGAFGYMDIFFMREVYQVAFAGLFVAALGWLLAMRKPEDRVEVRGKAWLWLLAGFTFLLYARINMQYFQSQARYLFPAVATLGMLFGGGAALLSRRFGWGVFAAALVALNLYALSILPFEFERRAQRNPVASILVQQEGDIHAHADW